MLQPVQFGAIHRLVDNGQPVTDEARARAAFGEFQTQNNDGGYFFGKRPGDRLTGPFEQTYIMTDDDKTNFVAGIAELMKLSLKAIFSKKAERKHDAKEKQLWQDTFDNSQPLEISTLGTAKP